MQKAVISRKEYEGKFKEFDKAYIDDKTPFDEEKYLSIEAGDINAMKTKQVNNLNVSKLSNMMIQDYRAINANYVLYPPRNQNKAIIIYFKKLTAK